MTIIPSTRPASLATSAGAGFGRRLLIALRNWRLRRQTDAKLNALDNHTLKDIGLRRDHNGNVFRP